MSDKIVSLQKEIISEKVFKAGYVVKKERHFFQGEEMIFDTAYTPNGDYISEAKIAHYLCVKKGIRPQLINSRHQVCSIGFSHKDGKWYGWSHRAIHGFKKGDVVRKGNCTAEYLPIGFKAKNIADAKKMAIAFANSVA